MKSLATYTLVLFAIVVGVSSAQIPRIINYQGRAADASGPLENQTRQMTLRIYDGGGSILWVEQQNVAFQTGGVFTVALGAVSPFPPSLGFDAPYALGVTIQNFNGGNEMPRIPLRSVPYAMRALTAGDLQAPATIAGNTSTSPTLSVIANDGTQNGYALVTTGVDSTSAHYVAAGNADTGRVAPGSYYRDNAPIAWGTIDFDASIISEFGLASVSYNDTINGYVIRLDNDVPVSTKPAGPALSVMITSCGTIEGGAPTIGQWSYYTDKQTGAVSPNTFIVRLFYGASGQSGRAPFSLQVFGRPR